MEGRVEASGPMKMAAAAIEKSETRVRARIKKLLADNRSGSVPVCALHAKRTTDG
jgi:hypothetical protein